MSTTRDKTPTDGKKSLDEIPLDEEVTEIEQIEEEPEEPGEPIESLETERDSYKDKYMRTYAELENFRKRVTKEKQEIMKFGNEKLLHSVLQIKDDLDRATLHQETADLKTLRKGLALIGGDLEKILTQFHVEPIETVGKDFDPNFHEAMAEEESDEHSPGAIISQYQTGYLYHGRLLRPARVIVAKKPKT